MSNYTWSREATKKLINQFRDHPELWDSKSPEFKNRAKRSASIEGMALYFGTNINEINRKLHNLRSQMNQELNKLRTRRSLGTTPVKCPWVYFDALRFLARDMLRRNRRPSLEREKDDNSFLLDVPRRPETPPGSSPRPILVPNSSMHQPQVTSPGSSQPKKPKLNTEDGSVLDMALKIMNNQKDDADIFGSYVAASLRDLRSSESARKLKRRIQIAILEISDMDEMEMSGAPQEIENVPIVENHDQIMMNFGKTEF